MSPETFTTLIEMLAFRAADTPAKPAFRFDGEPCTYGSLWRRINDFAAHLQALGVEPGDRVIMTLPNGPEFFFAFYGAQRAGATAVPLFPGFGPEKVLGFARLSGARLAVVPSDTPADLLSGLKTLAADHGLTAITVSDAAASHDPQFPEVAADDFAFIQYTSGSTGDPKGVQISHRNLLTNMRQMIDGMQITRDDVFVSWLPVYHDMGLILKTMVPFYLGLDLYLLPANLRDVSRWLETIQKHRATFTAAPDFAYRLCLRQISDPGDYDLTTLRVALNAAEPVRRRTIEEFEKAFRLKNVLSPAYGLAEATVGVSMWPPNTPIKSDRHGHVSIGRPFRGVGMAIVENGEPVAVGEAGEIAIESEALPVGYLDNPAANEALFWRPGWILSGDLGYVDGDGDFFIVGRKKNTIILAGRTLYTQEIEEIADAAPAVRYAVAVGISRNGMEGEQAYIFAEIRDGAAATREDYEAIVVDIVEALFDQLGFRPGRVYLVKPKTIPMTYNGKFQHGRLRDMYLSGSLAETGKILFPDY